MYCIDFVELLFIVNFHQLSSEIITYHNSPTIRPPFLSSSSRRRRGVGVYPGTCADYTPILCCCINALPPSTTLFVQLQVQRQGQLLIALKACSISRPFERFHDRTTRSLSALSLILVKDLLVSSMYTLTGESKLQYQPLHVALSSKTRR